MSVQPDVPPQSVGQQVVGGKEYLLMHQDIGYSTVMAVPVPDRFRGLWIVFDPVIYSCLRNNMKPRPWFSISVFSIPDSKRWTVLFAKYLYIRIDSLLLFYWLSNVVKWHKITPKANKKLTSVNKDTQRLICQYTSELKSQRAQNKKQKSTKSNFKVDLTKTYDSKGV